MKTGSQIIPCKELENPVKFQTHETLFNEYFTLSNGDDIMVPAGFKFDGRSSPGILRWLFPKWNNADRAYLLHDWLYVVDYKRDEWGWIRSKVFSDWNMLLKAFEYNPGWPHNWAFWDNALSFLGVLIFGSNVYKKDRL